jgi:hypothetical protein
MRLQRTFLKVKKLQDLSQDQKSKPAKIAEGNSRNSLA